MPQVQKRKAISSPVLRLAKRKCTSSSSSKVTVTDAVEEAMRIFNEVLYDHALERDHGKQDGEKREDRASEWMEDMVAESGYDEMKDAMLALLPFVGSMKKAKGSDYHVVESSGFQPPRHLDKGKPAWVELGKKLANGIPQMEKLLGARLACMRSDPHFLAWEAFCAIMSILSARKEKTWLELFPTREELEDKIKDLIKKNKLCKSKTSQQRKDVIRAFLEKESSYGYGYFAHYLVKPQGCFRVAFAPGKSLTPAVLVITERLPLWECLASPNDDEGDSPLRAKAKSLEWCKAPGTEFALQEVNLGVSEKDVKCRADGETLQADPKLRALLVSRKPVVYLEVVASLAPRAMAKDQGHSAIVKAELANLMREAKKRGEAVVFALGSDSPHTLFEKVYNRPPISDYGLRCGYMRWRASADMPWAREAPWADRCCICVQLP